MMGAWYEDQGCRGGRDQGPVGPEDQGNAGEHENCA